MSRRLKKSDIANASGHGAGQAAGQEPVQSAEDGSSQGPSIVAAVIWIDATPILKVEQAKLRLTKKKLSVAEERVRLHKQSDEPEYQRWFNATFSERLADIRELYEKLANLDSIVWKVEREILATGCSAAEAYEIVMRAIDEDETAKGESPDDTKASETPEEEDEGVDSRSDESKQDEPEWEATAKAKQASSSKEKSSDDLMKQIYRQLVRKLHPDLNPDLPESARERWFEVQQAYDDRDLARLEMLLAACEDGDDAGSDDSFIDKIMSLSRLRMLMKSVAKKLKESQRQLTKLKKAPAWEFHKTRKDPRRLSYLERDVKFELRNAEDALESDIRTLESQIERWRRPAPQRRRGRRDWNLSFDY